MKNILKNYTSTEIHIHAEEEIEDLLHISFPEVDVDTLNGFLIHEMGRLPKAKEQVEVNYGGYRFITVDVQDNMIAQVKVRKEEKEETE